jgi:hypothetical protein
MVAHEVTLPAESDAPRWAHLPAILTGVVIAVLGWWATYVASRAFGQELASFVPPTEAGVWIVRISLLAAPLTIAVIFLRWPAAATAASVTAVLLLALGAFARYVAEGLFLIEVGPQAPPGQGLASGDPLLGVVNDLGYGVLESLFYPPLLVLTAAWLAIALLSSRPRRQSAGDGVSWGSLGASSGWLLFLFGGILVPVAAWLLFIAEVATLAMFVEDVISPLQPVVVMAVAGLSTYLLLRVPNAASGAVAVAVALLVVSIITGGTRMAFSRFGEIWSFDQGDFLPALNNVAYISSVLVLFGTWLAIALVNAWRRAP